MGNNLKKGFTLMELLIVIAIIGIVTVTLGPRIMNSLNQAKVAKVKHKLGLIRLKLSFEENLSETFPDLLNNNVDLKNKFDVKPTETFSFNDKRFGETDNMVLFRDNKGGWIYNKENGEVYANLPDGAYTLDVENEIWGGETVPTSQITYVDTLSYGKLQFLNEDGYWEDMVDGDVYPADAEIIYIPTESISDATNQVNIGTNTGEAASLNDWGTVTGNTAVLESNGTTITTTIGAGNLKVFNGPNSHLGAGIGSTNNSTGLADNNNLRIDIDGEDINKVVFTLDGLGGYFDATSSNATKVEISAYDENNNLIETQSSYRTSGSYLDEYSFEITQPVSYFKLGTSGSNGSYVVQSVDLIKSAQDQVNLTIQNPDGTTSVITKDILLDDTNSDDIITIIESPKEEEN